LHTLLLPTLLLIGVYLCEVLELVVSFPTSQSSLKTKFVCISYCVFGFGGFTGSFLWEVLTSHYLIFYLLLILGLYLFHWIGLSLSFSKSPSLLKTESGRKSYDRFHLPSFSDWCKSCGAGIFTGRPVSGRRRRAVHRPVRLTARRCRGGRLLRRFWTETPTRTPNRLGPGACTGRSGAEPGATDF
jgi:hypothetical protein